MEFAIVLPVLLLVLMGIIDFAFMFKSYEVVTNAAREGARVGVLSGYSMSDAEARALAYLDAAGMTDARRAATATPTTITVAGSAVNAIQVQVTYPHDFLLLAPISALVGGSLNSITLTGNATMRTEAQSGS